MVNKFIATLGLIVLSSTANAELIPGTNLSLDFHAASIAGNGTKINMYRVPVTEVTTGKTTYWDAEFVFGLLPDGSLSFTRTASAAQSTTQLLNGQAFIPGKYKDVKGVLYSLTGPVAAVDGRQQWHLASITAGKVFSADFYTGPVNGHPNQSEFHKDLKDGPAFGIMGSADFNPLQSGSSLWTSGAVVAATQYGGNGITIFNYFNASVLTPSVSFDLLPN